MADGFSCREQIAQCTDRRAFHLADVLKMAITRGPRGPAGDYPESTAVREYQAEVALSGRTATGVAAGVALALAGAGVICLQLLGRANGGMNPK